MKLPKVLALSMTLLAWASIAAAGNLSPGLETLTSGMSDTETIKVLVVMKDQADITTLDWDLHDRKISLDVRHSTVLETLQAKANGTQRNLLASLEDRKATGDILGYTPHWLINAVVVKGTLGAIRDLAARPDVDVVEADLVAELIEPVKRDVKDREKSITGIGMTPGVQAVNAPLVWQEFGNRGAGAVVGILDTGVEGSHPALADNWRGNFAPADECWFDAADFGDATPQDHHYHGTHVMGTICGLAPDDTIGVAPDALWIASNVINQGVGSEFDNDVLASLEFMADPDGNPDTSDDVPDVVQNSWGINENFTGYFDCDSRWWDAMDNCEAAGVVLTWSAGNEGPGSGSLRSPADRAATPHNAFSVGSVDATNYPFPYPISSFSSRGPTTCPDVPPESLIKPEVCAPGSDVYSAAPGGGYQYLSGTSMAGPHVAGVVALMRAANPTVDVITIKDVLMNTAVDLGTEGEDNTYGHGLVDAYQAVLFVMGGIGQVEGTVTDADTGLPISFAVVRDVGGFNVQSTDDDGYYSMTLTAEEHTLEFSAFGYYSQTQTVTVPEDGLVAVNIALQPAPASRVYGYVFDPEGQLLEGASISAPDTPVPGVTSNAEGYYELFLPDGGTYRVVGEAAGLGGDEHEVVLNGDTQQNFLLRALVIEDYETGDFSKLPWQFSGNADWFVSTDAYEGIYAAQSGDINDNQQSVLSVTLNVGSGDVSFFYKVSSESNYDFLRFEIDGNQLGAWSGSVGWTEGVFPVSAGPHTFTWKYTKDGSVSTGADAGWVDLIKFPGAEEPLLPQLSLGFTSLEFTIVPGDVKTQPKYITNTGEGPLTYFLALAPAEEPTLKAVAPAIPPAPQLPHLELAKGEEDPRPGVVPVTGQGGPDEFGYSWIDSDEIGGPVYEWVEINGVGNVVGSGDDANHGPFDLGFTFSYYDNDYTSVRVCTNGWISFTATNTTYSNQTMPNTSAPNNIIAPFWDDLNPNSGGTIYYYQDLANARFVIEWDGVPHFPSGNPETFQVILNADGSIVYQYETVSLGTSSTVGIENLDGTDGLQIVYNGAYLHSDLAIRIASVPPVPWLSVTPEGGLLMPNAGQRLDFVYDATELSLGTYEAILVVNTNDPAADTLIIPILLTVAADVVDVGAEQTPNLFALDGAQPNPFNPLTEISFSIPTTGPVSLKIYDVSGRLVRTLLDELVSAGANRVRWNGTDDHGRAVASGTYYARLQADGQEAVRPMVLVR